MLESYLSKPKVIPKHKLLFVPSRPQKHRNNHKITEKKNKVSHTKMKYKVNEWSGRKRQKRFMLPGIKN